MGVNLKGGAESPDCGWRRYKENANISGTGWKMFLGNRTIIFFI
jgi:hypothetical protein